MAVSYTSLEPTSLKTLNVEAPSFTGATASFFATSQFVYMLLFVAIIVAAFYRYALAGVYRMEASEAGIRKSNEVFKKVTLGLLGVFSLFLILFTVNKGLITGDITLDALRVKGVPGTGGTSQPANPPSGAAGAPAGASEIQAAINSDATVRRQLQGLGISVNKSVCPNTTETNCTTVGGVHTETLSMLQSLRSKCGGSIEITGGTEPGHSSHGPGKYPVDIGIKDSTLNACVRAFEAGPTIGFCNQTYKNFGYLFCDEKNTEPHWHVYK